MVQKYPVTIQDRDEDEVVLGDGCQSTLRKLIDRNKNLNKPHKRRPNQFENECPVKNTKKQLNKRSGCLNCAPSVTDQNIDVSLKQTGNTKENIESLIKMTFPN